MYSNRDDFRIFTDSSENVPYYAVVLTPEQSEEIKDKEICFYKTDGRTLFEVRDGEGKPTGETVFYIMFK